MPYQPQPIDASGITLPEGLEELTERLAKNVHDVWAQQRMAEGWTWGSARSDTAKKNPCLVPYDQLPDTEKDYDRDTAVKTLKAIIALGYKIVKG